MKINTYLPLFPGFYSTLLEPDEYPEIEHINEVREAKNLPPVDFSDGNWDYSEYMDQVGKNACNYVSEKLAEIGIEVKFEFDGIQSPKEYNFTNDQVKVVTTVNWWELRRLFLKTDCDEYLKNQFSSRPGFVSFYPKLVYKWNWEQIKSPDNVHIEHMLAAILCCHEDSEYSEEELCEKATENVGYYCINYDELTSE